VLQLDLRHWFHQIPVDDALQRWFGLRCKDADGKERSWTWTALPMGWSWSPAVAQSLAWMIWLLREPGQNSLFKTEPLEEEGAGLPTWVSSASGFSHVTTYYDNLICVSRSKQEIERIAKRVKSNAEALNAFIKDGTFTIQDVRVEDVTILGMTCRRTTDGLEVRPKKHKAWTEEKLPDTPESCRYWARFIGRLVFTASLRSQRITDTTLGIAAVRLAREVGQAAGQHGWDSMIQCPSQLRKIWARLALEIAGCLPSEEVAGEGAPAPDVVMASDSSQEGWCFCILQGRRLVFEKKGLWKDTPQASDHIFFKELYAALYGLIGLKALFPGQRAHLVGDNSAVCWVLRRGVSKCLKAQNLLDEHRITLREAGGPISLVVSNDNPADPDSRGRVFDTGRAERMFHALDSERDGVR
jgi:hypothetical protein